MKLRRVTRREFIGTAVATTAALSTTALAAPRPRPNVLFILADDLGYGDLSCYGRPDYQTPVLDGLARQGLQFMSAYAAAPVCTPTRCAFHTGRYPQRLPVGLEEPLTPRTPDLGLPAGHPTIASLLKASDYETALIGKWHLGWKPESTPTRHGFDHFYGILSGAADYFTHKGIALGPCRLVGGPAACRAARVPHRSPDGQSRGVRVAEAYRSVLSKPSLHRAACALGRT
jgi:hypothetical protein